MTKTLQSTGTIGGYRLGEGVTILGYSDAHACTIIRITRKTITLQRDKATLMNGMNSGEPDALQADPGGFCAHVSGIQRYSYTSDPDGNVVTARLTNRGWMAGGKRVIDGRHEHYDYNF